MESTTEEYIHSNPTNEEIPQFETMDKELLELNEVIDLIKSNSIEHIAEIFHPRNSTKSNSSNSDGTGSSHSFIYHYFIFVSWVEYMTFR